MTPHHDYSLYSEGHPIQYQDATYFASSAYPFVPTAFLVPNVLVDQMAYVISEIPAKVIGEIPFDILLEAQVLTPNLGMGIEVQNREETLKLRQCRAKCCIDNVYAFTLQDEIGCTQVGYLHNTNFEITYELIKELYPLQNNLFDNLKPQDVIPKTLFLNSDFATNFRFRNYNRADKEKSALVAIPSSVIQLSWTDTNNNFLGKTIESLGILPILKNPLLLEKFIVENHIIEELRDGVEEARQDAYRVLDSKITRVLMEQVLKPQVLKF